MGNKVFTFGDIRIREVKGKYYVYIIEKGDDGQRRDNYVGSLEQIVKEYYDMKCRGRDLNPGHRLERPAYCRRVELDRAILPRHLYTTP